MVIDGKGPPDGWALTLNELMEKGKATSPADWYEAVVDAVKNDDLATLIYTSGTTGKPKGVVLTHDCWVYEAEAIDELKLVHEDDCSTSGCRWRTASARCCEVAQLRIGFQTAIDGRIDKIVENLGQVRPTFVAAVPRIFEKVYNKVVEGTKKDGGAKYAIFKWAFGVGREVSALRQKRQEPDGPVGAEALGRDELVFSKLQTRFGGRLRYFVSGGAPLARDLAEFFHAAGILILEGYGLTETSAATS